MTLILACVFRYRAGFGLNIPAVLCRGQDLEQQSGPVRKRVGPRATSYLEPGKNQAM